MKFKRQLMKLTPKQRAALAIKTKRAIPAKGANTMIQSRDLPTSLPYGMTPAKLVARLQQVSKTQEKIKRVEQDQLYSCYLMPATAAIGTYDLFVTQVGQIGQGFATNLTRLETNVENGGRVPDQYGYAIHSIGCFWDPFVFQDEPDAFAEVGHRVAVSYSFGEKEKQLGPAVMYPGGGGIQGFSTVTDIGICSNGSPGANNLYPLAEPIMLPPGTNFKFTLSVTGAGAAANTPDDALENTNAFRFWIRLVGLRAAYVVNG